MTNVVDSRIVEMRFDNQQFESGVQQSLNSVEKLKQGLDFDGSIQGMQGLAGAARKVDLSMLTNSVTAVQQKFSALEVMAVTALANITNSAVNAGKQIVKDLTITPVSTGFKEYEQKMGSIQTIMASTGESLDKVNAKLDELNLYSDRTIYSFSDMTQNIGKFTNAGVKLDDAVAAIQGVSNVAAVSGANANEASRAMYNFAQALSAGYVKLIDWKSIENANMATVEFKTQLLESAVAAGTLKKTADGMYEVLTKSGQGGTMKETINATHMFNDSLSYQWMTTEVLTETLKDYADETTEIGKKAFAAAEDVKTFSMLLDTLKESAQSGWATTWQLFVGDFEEAKKTLTEYNKYFSDLLDASAKGRNELLQGTLMSSWGQLKQQVNDAGLSVDEFTSALTDLGKEANPKLGELLESGTALEDTFSEGWVTTELVTKALNKLAEASDGSAQYTQKQVDNLRELYGQAYSSSGAVRNFVDTINRPSGRELIFDSILNAFKALEKAFSTIKKAWTDIFPTATADKLYGIIEAVHSFSERLIISDKTADLLGQTFKGLFAVLDIVKQAFTAVFNAVFPLTNGVGSLATKILECTAWIGNWLVGLDESVKETDIFNKIVQKLVGFVTNAGEVLGFVVGKIREFVDAVKERFVLPGFTVLKNVLNDVKDRFTMIGESATSFKETVSNAFQGIADIFARSNFLQGVIALFNGIKTIATTIASALGTIIGNIGEKMGDPNFNNIIDLFNGASLSAIAAGMAMFIGKLTDLMDGAANFKESILDILEGVKGCLTAWQTDLKASALTKIASAVAILAASLVVLSLVDSITLSASLGALTVMLVDLMAAMKAFTMIDADPTKFGKAATAMVSMSAAVLVLALAIKAIGNLDLPAMVLAVSSIAGLMALLVGSFKILGSGSGTVVKGASQMILFAAAIKVLASAVEDLSDISWEGLAKGLVGVGALLAEVDIFLATAKFSGKGTSTAIGILGVSAAIKILASACKDFGQMSGDEIGKGLVSVGALLAELAAFTVLTGNAKHVTTTGLAMIELGAAMKIFASAMGDFGGMSWENIAKGLVAMGGALAELTLALNLMPKNMLSIGTGLIAVGAALEILNNVLSKMGGMSWEEIAKGLVALGGAMVELGVGLNVMNGTLAGSAALTVAAVGLNALVPVMKNLGNLTWEQIAKGMITLAGALTVIGVAGAVLSPILPSILGLAASITLFGAGVFAVGTGLTLAAAGITALTASLSVGSKVIVGALTAIIAEVLDLVPVIVGKLGDAFAALLGIIIQNGPIIGETIKTLILTLADVLLECVPVIADTLLVLITELLNSLVTYTPTIVDSLMTFLIDLINGVANRLPELIKAAINLIGSFFTGVIEALRGVDTSVLLEAIAGIGLLSAMMVALSSAAPLVPGAIAGVLGMGAVLAEIAVIIAAMGVLEQIPGLEWLVGEGGKLLEAIGVAIGSFLGGIIGGTLSGITGQFAKIGSDLSAFMVNATPFLQGAMSIKPGMMDGVNALIGTILLMTATDIIQGLTSWATGGSSLADFGKDLVPFGETMVEFGQAVAGLDADLVSKAALAGKTLAEMASTLPNTGGVVDFFTGTNDMEAFGDQLVPFGKAMLAFSNSIKGMDADAVVNASNAGKTVAEMAATLPNSGGVLGFFAGENDIGTFGTQLVLFGKGMKSYSDSIKGIDNEAITESATAGKALVELADTIPNCGGLLSFLSGDNDMAAFGVQLESFGKSIKKYSESVKDFDADAVTSSASVGTTLVELANTIPNTGGLVAFFEGDNDIGAFGESMVEFGTSMKTYSDVISGFNGVAVTASIMAGRMLADLQKVLPESEEGNFIKLSNQLKPFGEAMLAYSDSVVGLDTDAIENSVRAGESLAKLQSSLTQMGGLVDFFTGSNDLTTFSIGIVAFGAGMKLYSDAIAGIDTDAIEASATAAQSLVQLQNGLPNVGGVVDFFTGGNDLGTFAAGLKPFGEGMKSYSDAIAEIDSDAVTASAVAAQSLAQLQASLPNVGGVVDFFVGGKDIQSFAAGLQPFGQGLKEYADEVAGIDPETVTASTTAGMALVELQTALPNVGGVVEFFTGGNDLGTFAEGLKPFGEAMKSYSDSIAEINPEAVSASTTAAQSLVELQKSLPNVGGVVDFFTGSQDMAKFGDQLATFGEDLAGYAEAVKDVKPDTITASANAATALSSLATSLPSTSIFDQLFEGDQTLTSFGTHITSFGHCIKNYYNEVANVDPTKLSAILKHIQDLADVATSLKGIEQNGVDQLLKGMSDSLDENADEVANKLSEFPPKLSREVVPLSITVGHSMGVALREGLISASPEVEKAGKDIGLSALNATKVALDSHSPSNEYILVGKACGQGLEIGLDSTTPSVKKAGSKIGTALLNATRDALDCHSPSVNMKEIGLDCAEGLENGLDAGIFTVKKKAIMFGKQTSVSIADGMSSGGTEAATESWLNTILNGSDKAKKEVEKTTKTATKSTATTAAASTKATKSAYDKFVEYIEEEQFYNRITTEEQLAQYEKVRKTYKLTADEIKKCDRQIYTLKNQLVQESYQGVLDWMDEEKFYNRLTTQEELDTYKDMQSQYAEGTEQRKKIDREVYTLENQLASEHYQSVLDYMDEEKFYNRLSKEDELKMYEELQNEYAEGTEQRKKIDHEIYTLRNELISDSYQSAVDWMEEEKFYNRLTTEEELANYEKLLEQYEEGSEERKKIEREIYTLKNDLQNEAYQNSLDWIEEEKYYDRLSLAEELAAYKRMQQTYSKGTEQRKKLDREVYRLEKEMQEAQEDYIANVQQIQADANQKRLDLEQEYADKVTEINERLQQDIQSLTDEYQSQYQQRADSLYKAYGLFDEVKEREEVNGETLLQNLQGQIEEFANWQDTLDNLSARGLEDEMISELREMGPSAISQIEALNNMSDDELSKYVGLWSIKHAQAREQAATELEDLRIDTQNQIEQLQRDADAELEEYRAIWEENLAQVNSDANDQLEKLQNDFAKQVGILKDNTEDQLQEMADNAQKILTEAGWDETGQAIPEGLGQGVVNAKSSFIDELTNLALEGISAVEDVLEINSPSKVATRLGEYTGVGFINGLTEYATKSYEAGSEMAGNTKAGITEAIRNVGDIVADGLDLEPTIRPVIDLTNVSNGANRLSSMFSSQRTIGLAGRASSVMVSHNANERIDVRVENNDVVKELHSLRGDMNTMMDRIQHMKVVTDTGKLVGEMAGPMDSALGQRQVYKRRGI